MTWPKRQRPQDQVPEAYRRGEQVLTVFMIFVVVMALAVWLTKGWGW